MAEIFQSIRKDYTQTCSKTEQLTLALFMEAGHYQTNIKKLRNLYAQKLQMVTRYLSTEKTQVTNTSSGLTVIIHVDSNKSEEQLCEEAASAGIKALPIPGKPHGLLLYYNQIPLEEIPDAIRNLLSKWYD